MQIHPQKIGYLRLVRERSGRPSIEQLGEMIGQVHTRFALIPDLEHLRLAGDERVT
jgi:hypothetical protein